MGKSSCGATPLVFMLAFLFAVLALIIMNKRHEKFTVMTGKWFDDDNELDRVAYGGYAKPL